MSFLSRWFSEPSCVFQLARNQIEGVEHYYPWFLSAGTPLTFDFELRTIFGEDAVHRATASEFFGHDFPALL